MKVKLKLDRLDQLYLDEFDVGKGLEDAYVMTNRIKTAYLEKKVKKQKGKCGTTEIIGRVCTKKDCPEFQK